MNGPKLTAPLTRLAGAFRPVYDVLFYEPISTGRLRLHDLSFAHKHATIVGLLSLIALLVSLLMLDFWRSGELIHVSESSIEGVTFVPAPLLPATLLAFWIAWSLLLWGSVMSSAPVRVALAVLYLLINVGLSRPIALEAGGSNVIDIARVVALIGYCGPPLVLLVLAALARGDRAVAVRRAAVPVLVVLAGMLFGASYAVFATSEGALIQSIPLSLSLAISGLNRFLLPLIVISGFAVIEFSYDLARAFAVPAAVLRASVAKFLLLGLLALKIYVQFARDPAQWWNDAMLSITSTIETAAALAGLLAAAWLFRRVRPHPDAAETAKDRLFYTSGLTLASASLVAFLLGAIGAFFLEFTTQLDLGVELAGLVRDRRYESIVLLSSCALLAVGIWLLRRRPAGSPGREFAFGAALVGAWMVALWALRILDLERGVWFEGIDLMLTFLIAGYALVRWRRLETPDVVRLGALVGFLWLVSTEGDFLAIIGSLVGVPGVFIVVVGILFALVSDSSFANEESAHFPRRARPLLWVGYLLLSVTILHWTQATHELDLSGQFEEFGFYYLAPPLGVWLLTRRAFTST